MLTDLVNFFDIQVSFLFSAIILFIPCFKLFNVKKLLKTKKVAEAVARRFSLKKVFLEILQNSREKTCARVSFLIKL